MGFLANLADQISSQFSLGENTTTSLDAVVNGQNQKYGSLGDFANNFDQSAQRSYVEEGFLRRDPYNSDPKQFEVLMQEPNATILVKKSMFSSINENYRPDFMDADEKLYYKSMKVLFQNKCRQIANLEKLSKIQKVTAAVGNVSDQLMPIIIGLTDSLNQAVGGSNGIFNGPSLFGTATNNGDMTSLNTVLERVRRIYAFNTTNTLTTWITDPTNLFQSQLGQGTGVIEITNFTSLNTTVTNSLTSPGGFGFNISDPYESMLITSWDIEKAISDATNAFYNHKVYQFGQQSSDQVINDAKTRLSQLRQARGVSDIEVIVNPNTVINRRVTAIIDANGVEIKFTYSPLGGLNPFSGGSGVTVDPSCLEGGSVAGVEGLSTSTNGIAGIGPNANIRPLVAQSELAVFQQLISATYSQIQLQANSQNAFQIGNKNTNYARRKLNFQFLGKLVIQPMDIVHIYINSKSRWDNKLLGGLQQMYMGFGILQSINNTITDLANATSTLFNPSGNIQIQSEKASFVGADFPNYLWALLRNQFVTEKEGTHVFAGVVDSAPSSWQDGKFTINVNGKDNTAYFDMGKVNFKPGVDVFNGALFDPLTPFKTTFDTINSNAKSGSPQLLQENMFLLGNSTDGTPPIVKFKNGPNAGRPAYQDNIAQQYNLNKVTANPNKVYYAPDGLVYKWKEGIGTLVQFGNSIDINDPSNVGNPAITKEPFAGQDVMNVISLLITGQPYNFSTYWKAVSTFDGFNRDPQSQQDSAYSFYASLRTDLTRNNITWGNFIPYKNLVMDEQSFAAQMQGQIRAVNTNSQIDSLLQQYAELKRQINVFSVGAVASNDQNNQNSKFSTAKLKAETQANDLSQQITALINNLQKSDQSNSSSALGPNGDPSFSPGDWNSSNDNSDAQSRRTLRRQLNYLTRRMSYNVRANEDKNLFIVDDSYDKDYDIIAYEESLGDIKLYNNEFQSVKDKIVATADLLNLEIFADTQGHIRARSPQYNRMPSSVFYRMMYLKKAYGIQIFPQFLEDLFQGQIDNLVQQLEVQENYIRLDCAILGFETDADCVDFILNGVSAGSGTGASPGGGGITMSGEVFNFISNEGTAPNYSFKITDMSTVVQSANPDNSTNNLLQSLSSQAKSTKTPFSNTERYQIINQSLTTNTISGSGVTVTAPTPIADNPRIDALIQAIKTETGTQISNDNYLVSTSLVGNGVNIPAGQSIDVFKVTQELSTYIRQRQKTIKLLYGAIKNAQEATSLDNNSNQTANELNPPGIYGNSNVPEMFEHMIEDETYDDYGPGSGSRYIIKRAQIRSLSISESPPDFTYIEVKGQLDPLLPNTVLPGELNSFPQGGNGLVSAAAVDYDLWRKFGFRQQSPINVPFLKDPNNQCAPYASMILSRARKNILRGSVTISGNEYMQPGEVVFLQDRLMLFYVTSVKHNFTFGSGFTTTLDLAYGHAPGDYIPTTLDVIGKMLYNNRDLSTTPVLRQTSAFNENNMGVVVSDPQQPQGANIINTGSPGTTQSNSGYTASNGNTINNILYQAAYMINANASSGNTVNANVELRIYYDNSTPVSTNLQSFANQVQSILTTQGAGPIQQYNQNTTSTPPALPSANVSVVTINLDDQTVSKSPSQKAIDMARNMVGKNSTSGGGAPLPGNNTSTANASSSMASSQQQVRINLYNYVVDCWLTFTQVPTNQANSTTTTP